MPAEGAVRDGNQADFELIETLRWEPLAGFVRLDLHLGRLQASAEALGFAFSRMTVEEALRGAAGGAGPMRVRLTLAGGGKAEVTTQPFTPLSPDAVWNIQIAETRLYSADPMLRHKTTLRDRYNAARAEFSRQDAEEVLLLNERGEVCEGTITNIFIDRGDGRLLTPALSCGLLPGVLRGELIVAGKAAEAVLTVEDLRAAKTVYVGNSLRGLIRARLVG
jgi:4-amino-4-deoxychorismate lyase